MKRSAYVLCVFALVLVPALVAQAQAWTPVWQEQNTFIASDGWATDYFGFAVALDGDAIMIGADNAARDDSVEQGEGAVYFFSDDRIFGSGGEE